MEIDTSGDSASAMLLEFRFKRDGICQLLFLTKEMSPLPSFLVIGSWPGKENPATLTVAPRTVFRILGGGCRYSVHMRAYKERSVAPRGWEGATEKGTDTGPGKLKCHQPAVLVDVLLLRNTCGAFLET